jgi:tetratricopeptide (TPR) repeat protein
LGELERARVNYKRALDATPLPHDTGRESTDYLEALKLYGATLLQLGQAAAATEIFQQAVKLAPTSPSLYDELGKCLYRIGELEKAKGAFQKALELNSEDSQAYSNLGVLFWETGKVDAAITNLQQAIEINPDDADALANLAIICYQMELFAEAIPLFKKLLIRQPQVAQMHFYLGDCYFQTGENLKAKEELQIVLAAEPEHQPAQNLSAKLKNLEAIK